MLIIRLRADPLLSVAFCSSCFKCFHFYPFNVAIILCCNPCRWNVASSFNYFYELKLTAKHYISSSVMKNAYRIVIRKPEHLKITWAI